MTKLTDNIRPFNFEEFFDLVEQCDTNSRNLEKQNIILLLGTTGAGKSTFIQYMFGATMVKFKNGHIEAHPMPDEIKSFLASA
jgi:ABC-type sugar transport system ATPase subunit